MRACVCACVCVRARARACVRTCVRVCFVLYLCMNYLTRERVYIMRKKNSETRMSANVLKQDPNIPKVKRNANDDTKHMRIFGVSPFFKRQKNNQAVQAKHVLIRFELWCVQCLQSFSPFNRCLLFLRTKCAVISVCTLPSVLLSIL